MESLGKINRSVIRFSRPSSNEEDIARLIELGLNRYEASIYVALVTDGPSTAKELSNITHVPYGKIYEMLDSLAIKGFVHLLPTKPLRCKAVSPKDAIASIRQELERRFDKVEEHALRELEPRYCSSSDDDSNLGDFFMIRGRSNITRQIEDILSEAKEKIYIYTTENGLKRLVAQKELLTQAFQRGAAIKISAPLTGENAEEAASLSFCQIRNSPPPQNSFWCIDGKMSLFVDHVPDNDNHIYGRDLAIVSSRPSFSAVIDQLYMRHWVV